MAIKTKKKSLAKYVNPRMSNFFISNCSINRNLPHSRGYFDYLKKKRPNRNFWNSNEI